MHRLTTFLYIVVAHAVPTVVVNLDDPPKKRFEQTARKYKAELAAMMVSWADQLTANINATVMAEWLEAHNYEQEHIDEIQGIVDIVNDSDVTLERMILWNLMYELHHPTFCSGLLMAQTDGTVIHGRNMDYTFFFKSHDRVLNWPDVTHETLWMRDNKPLFVSTGWPGHIGVSTGMRFDGWTIEQNTRKLNNRTNEENLAQAKKGAQAHNILVRKTLETVPQFEFAVWALSAANLMAPLYFIMSGPGPYQGAVLTKDRGTTHNFSSTPPVIRLNQDSKLWHVLQTNDDMLGTPSDIRRPIANGLLEFHKQQEVDPEFVLTQMRTPPLFNLATVYTWVAKVSAGEHYTFLPDENAITMHATKKTKTFMGKQRWLAPIQPNAS